MQQAERSLTILLATAPDRPGFRHAVNLAGAALRRGVRVYLYCLDDAVTGVRDERLQALHARGLRLYACAYAAQRRHQPRGDEATYAGLAALGELIERTDRFVSFA